MTIYSSKGFQKTYKISPWITRVGFKVLALSLVVMPVPLMVSNSQATPGINTETTELNATTKVFLGTIPWAEGTAEANGYQLISTGVYFSHFQDHPRQRECVMYQGKELCSDAAGRYQFLSTTWDRIALKLQLPDFSPRSQDLAALELIREQGAFEDLETEQWESAIYKVAPVWASLPSSYSGRSVYEQPSKSIEQLRSVYASNFMKYQQAGSQNVTQTPKLFPVPQPLPDCNVALWGPCN
jgi:muramidase (phage lysozyme)